MNDTICVQEAVTNASVQVVYSAGSGQLLAALPDRAGGVIIEHMIAFQPDQRQEYDISVQLEEEFELPPRVDLLAWLALAESSFDFWDNEDDAIYDDL